MKTIIHLVLLLYLFSTTLNGQIITPKEYQCNAEKLLKAYEEQIAQNTFDESTLLYATACAAYKVGEKEKAKEILENIIGREKAAKSNYYYLAQFDLYFYYKKDLELGQLQQEISKRFGAQHNLLAALDLIDFDRKYRSRAKINLDTLIPSTINKIDTVQLYTRYISVNLQNLSKFYAAKGKLQKGLKTAHQLYKFLAQNTSVCDSDFIGAYISLGRRHEDMNSLDSALFYFEKAYSFTKQYHPYSQKAKINCAINLADLWHKKGFSLKGIKYLEEAEAIALKNTNSDHTLLAMIYNNIGLYLSQSGKRKKAIEYFRKSVLSSENASDDPSPRILAANFNIGNQFMKLEEYQSAEKYFKRALVIAEQLYQDDHLNKARVLMALGSLYHYLDDIEKTKKYFDQSLKIRKSLYGETHSSIGNIYVNYALTFRDVGKIAEALKYIDRAINVYKDYYGSQHPRVANAYLAKARIEVELPNYTTATKSILQAKHTLACKDQYKACENYLLYLDIIQYEAMLYWHDFKNNQIGNQENIISTFEHAFAVFQYALEFSESLVDAAALSAEYSYFFNFYVEALVHFGALENNTTYLTDAYQINTYAKNLGLKKSLNHRTQLLFSNVPKEKREQLNLLRGEQKNIEQKLLAADLSSQDQEKLLLDSLNKISNHLTSLKSELKAKYPSYERIQKSNLPPYSEYLPSDLGPETALVDFRLIDSTLISFIVYEENIQVNRVLLTSTFEKQLDTFLNNINHPLKEAPSNTFLHPLLSAFEVLDKKITKLIIIPDIALASLPFELLENDKGQLLEQYAITYANSANIYSLQKALPRHATRIPFAGFAPEYPSQIDTNQTPAYASLIRSGNWSLPFGREEVEYISSFWNNSKSYLGNEATKSHLLEAIENSKILHLSMHAEVNSERPLNSRFIFNTQSDDEEKDLLLYELYNLNAKSEMVVLSACETGRGQFHKGEGVRSLGNGFLYAGVPSVVMSLWKVPDESTSKIMKSFYKYLEQGLSKDIALQQAKLDYLDNSIAPELQAPYYWAGFILSGDEAPIIQDKPWSTKTVILIIILLLVVFWWYSKKNF